MYKFNKLKLEMDNLAKNQGWKKHHNPKDLSLAISIESSELLEHFLWKKESEINQINKNEVFDEISDIYIYIIYLCNYYNVDINDIALSKMKKNKMRFNNEE